MPKKMLGILVYGLLIKILKIAMSCGANMAAASLLDQIIQKLIIIPSMVPLVMNNTFRVVLLRDKHAYTSQGKTRKI
jgi:hypothetical protein